MTPEIMKGTFTLTASSENPDAFSRECAYCHMRICSTRGPDGVLEDHAQHERECQLDYKLAKCFYEAVRDLECISDTAWEDLDPEERYAYKWGIGRVCDWMQNELLERLEARK